VRAVLLALVGLALGVPGSACGQDAVRSVRLVVDLTEADGAARVRVAYDLATQAGATVSATALEFAGARVENVCVEGLDAPLQLERPRALASSVRLPPAAATPGSPGSPGTSGTSGASGTSAPGRRVVATYEVPGAVIEDGPRIRAHVPVLSVDLPPEAASPGFFRAELHLPPGWRVAEGFPTGLDASATPGVYAVELAVVPAVLSLRARSDGRWRPGLPALLDAAAVALVAAFALLGWRHLRETA
jgi:hypothetical protein